MDDLISALQKIQSACTLAQLGQMDVQLPQFVVVGEQSTGKSSLLEGIVGRDFLPRGTGIVTRRPLHLHLKHVAQDDPLHAGHKDDWARFQHSPEEFEDFTQVRNEIEAETDRLSANKEIVAEPITLTIFSHRVVDLFLVDLPGLTKNPVGNQPKDVGEQTRRLVLSYIQNPRSLILAVAPMAQDFSTLDSILLANEVDPDKERTLLVLTKLDKLDIPVDASRYLRREADETRAYKIGVIGVKNRSQQDIISWKSREVCIQEERVFLEQHYGKQLAQCNGIGYLSTRLNEILKLHIAKHMPELREQLRQLHQRLLEELQRIGGASEEGGGKKAAMLRHINAFTKAFNLDLKGNREMNLTERNTGARIHYLLYTLLVQKLEVLDPLEEMTPARIQLAWENSRGLFTALFVDNEVLAALLHGPILRLKVPGLSCVDEVKDELCSYLHRSIPLLWLTALLFLLTFYVEIRSRYPMFAERIEELFRDAIDRQVAITKAHIEALIDAEVADINCQHPDLRDRFTPSDGSGDDVQVGSGKGLFYYSSSIHSNFSNRLASAVPPPLPVRWRPGPPSAATSPSDSSAHNGISAMHTINQGGREQGVGGRQAATFQNGIAGGIAGKQSQSKQNRRDSNASWYVAGQQSSSDNGGQFEVNGGMVENGVENSHSQRGDVRKEPFVSLILAYYRIVRKTVGNLVPKFIHSNLLNKIKDEIQPMLIEQLMKKKNEELLRESEALVTKRTELEGKIKNVKVALAAIEGKQELLSQ